MAEDAGADVQAEAGFCIAIICLMPPPPRGGGGGLSTSSVVVPLPIDRWWWRGSTPQRPCQRGGRRCPLPPSPGWRRTRAPSRYPAWGRGNPSRTGHGPHTQPGGEAVPFIGEDAGHGATDLPVTTVLPRSCIGAVAPGVERAAPACQCSVRQSAPTRAVVTLPSTEESPSSCPRKEEMAPLPQMPSRGASPSCPCSVPCSSAWGRRRRRNPPPVGGW